MKNDSYYYCFHCRSHIDPITQGLMAEQQSSVIFCSESCMTDFYSPLVGFFEEREQNLRQNHKIKEEQTLNSQEQQKILGKILAQADEYYLEKDQTGREFFHLVLKTEHHKQKLNVVLTCFMFSQKPSFILHVMITASSKLLDAYIGQSLRYEADNTPPQQDDRSDNKDENKNEEIMIPQELMDEIDQMRSQLLATVIRNQKDEDINVEDYYLFESYIEPTLSTPEEVFQYPSDHGQNIYVFIKSYHKSSQQVALPDKTHKKSFFYIVLSLKLDPKTHTDQEEVYIPILAFPTLDAQVYSQYRKGNCISRRSLN